MINLNCGIIYWCKQEIRGRVLLVGKSNNGKDLTRTLVIRKGKKAQIIKAMRKRKRINEE